MRNTVLTRSILVLLVVTALALPACGPKQPDYPQKPVTMIVGFTAGGSTDLAARSMAENAKAFFPQPITVVNKPGGGAAIGAADMIQSAPDGYTIAMLNAGVLTMSPHITSLPFKGPQDIEPIIGGVDLPTFIQVKADSQWKTMKDFVDYARANPGKLKVGFSGIGTSSHVFLEDLKIKAQIEFTLVPFPGVAESLTAVLGGHVDASTTGGAAALNNVRAGKTRIMVFFSDKRVPDYPDVPTAVELNYVTWGQPPYYFPAAPKGTPPAVLKTLHDALKKSMETESFQKFAKEAGFIVNPLSPDDMRKRLDGEYQFFADFTKKVKLQ